MDNENEKNREPLELGDLIGGLQRKASLSQKCTATSKRTGKQCGAWALRGARTCRVHGSATKKSKVAAKRRIAEASGYAADMLAEFMADPTIDVKQRVQIAQDLLTRAGYGGKTELTLDVSPWEKHFGEVVVDYTVTADASAEVIEDAVIVYPMPELEQAKEDEELRVLESKLRKRKRRTGNAYTLPTEDVPASPLKPLRHKLPSPPQADSSTPAWYHPEPLKHRTRPRRDVDPQA